MTASTSASDAPRHTSKPAPAAALSARRKDAASAPGPETGSEPVPGTRPQARLIAAAASAASAGSLSAYSIGKPSATTTTSAGSRDGRDPDPPLATPAKLRSRPKKPVDLEAAAGRPPDVRWRAECLAGRLNTSPRSYSRSGALAGAEPRNWAVASASMECLGARVSDRTAGSTPQGKRLGGLERLGARWAVGHAVGVPTRICGRSHRSLAQHRRGSESGRALPPRGARGLQLARAETATGGRTTRRACGKGSSSVAA